MSGPVMMNENFLLFHNGTPGTKTAFANSNMLHYDDFLDLRMKMRFVKKVTKTERRDTEDKLNAFMIQFVSRPNSDVVKNKNNNIVTLQGLVISLITHDNAEDINPSQQTSFFTFRYFPEQTQVSRDYLSHLFDRMTKHEGCHFRDLGSLTDLKITIDYEYKDELKFFYKNASEENFYECFTVNNISKYITPTKSFLLLQQTTGMKVTLSTEVHGIKLMEKPHRLDVDQNLHVSHDLVEEIFDKVKSFGQIFEEDRDNMESVANLQSQLMEKSQLLYIYSKDLNRGSRKFQEYMLESLNKHRIINPVNLPKMKAIKSKIDLLQEKQNKIFARFGNIINIIQTKNIIKKTFHNFKKIDKVIAMTIKEISSDEFKQFVGKTKKLMSILKKSDFEDFIGRLEKAALSMSDHVADASSMGIWIVVGVCACVGFFTLMIIRSISKANKNPFG